ncbi:MAG: iron uptake porin [Cyanobacteriota bacterium]|nr:iron uptake porin [Cyanobacteriota bacterium]
MKRILVSSIVLWWVNPISVASSPPPVYRPSAFSPIEVGVEVGQNSPTRTVKIDREPRKTQRPLFRSKLDLTPFKAPQKADTKPSRRSPLAQITSVSELSDVQPSDWAYQALQSLIERYGCIAGYPDGLFRGDRALTRYEFAAGLNACLQLGTIPNPSFFIEEDLAILQRLQEEYTAELATLRGGVDLLEARAAELEARQFSPTAILGGESIFAFSGGTGGDPGRGDTNPVFTHLTRLGIVSSLTGKDRLRLELTSGNFGERGFASPVGFNTDMALLSFQSDTENGVRLDKLEYRFAALGDRVVFTFRPVGFSLSNILTANSPYFDAGRGALSRFGEASPIFKIGSLDAGVGFDWLVTDTVRLQVGYGTRNTNDPDRGDGLFAADRSAAGVQFLLKPTADLLAGIAYVNAYSSDGRLDVFSGSFRADTASFLDAPAQIQGITGTLQWRVADNLTVNTWGGWTFTDAIDSPISATTTTYLLGLGYSDPFGRKGDLLAFLFGQPPKLVGGNDLPLGEDPDTSLHFELFYRLGITDRISITPGFFIVTNPEHDRDNDNLFIGAVRTTFRF